MHWTKSALAAGITERTFLNELIKNIINRLEDAEIISIDQILITRHKSFFILLAELHNDFAPIIKYNMLNSYGDISVEYKDDVVFLDGTVNKVVNRGGYSLNNEVVQMYMNTSILYKEK